MRSLRQALRRGWVRVPFWARALLGLLSGLLALPWLLRAYGEWWALAGLALMPRVP
ncbi:MAG: hypothetical protein HY727_15120 [Candidatus Rokubacteria bacterium]|nr:hypothetical protein [Candidatus Rokubacteria bacterium]